MEGRDSTEAQLLFLIYKYLSCKGHFGNTIKCFEKEIDALHLLGESYNWDGISRKTTIGDFCNRYRNFNENHLEALLQNQNNKGSGLMNPVNIDHSQVSENVDQIINIYNTITSTKKKIMKLFNRKLYLQQKLELDVLNDDLSFSTKNINKSLKMIGQHKELINISNELENLETIRKVYEKDSDSLFVSLQKNNVIVSSLFKGNCKSSLSWLSHRTLGLSSSSVSSSSLVSKGISFCSPIRKMTSNYRMLWTVSGHMMNPAYCVVFDRSGKYAITGADDYLVKVWEVERGVLIYTLKGHEAYIALIDVSPDNSLIASACTLGSIRLWSLVNGICVKVLNHGGSINWIKFDESSFALATAGDDGNCVVWDIAKILSDDYSIAPDDWKFKYPLLNFLKTESVNDEYNSTDISLGILENNLTLSSFTKPTIFRGLFGWSKSNENSFCQPHQPDDNRLVLPHLQDSLQLIQSFSNQIKVNCLDISPCLDILVTGCDDGIARVWKFGNDSLSNRNSRPVSLRNSHESNIVLSNNRTNQDYKRIETVNNYLLQRLEGHVSAITDLKFSKRGDRIVTGSLNDGTARIWAFNRNFTKHEQVVLIMKENDLDISDTIATFSYGHINNRRSSLSRKQLKTQVYNVGWTCDDLRIISLQSVLNQAGDSINETLRKDVDAQDLMPTRLKVWDSYTGDLLRTISLVGMKACKLLTLHPINPSIALTSGIDGIINIWDIEYEKNLCSFSLADPVDPSDHNSSAVKPSHIVDASFSPDGVFIALTDTAGRLTMLSLDQPNKHPQKYPEQYFSNDYADITINSDGIAIDVNTQMPVHEAPRGLLCRIDGYAYDSQPYFTGFGPKPFSPDEIIKISQEKKSSKKILLRLMDKTFGLFQRNKTKCRQTKQFTWNLTDSTISNSKSVKHTNIVRHQQKQRSIARAASMFETSAIGFNVVNYLSHSDDSDSNYSNQYDENEDDRIISRRRRSLRRNAPEQTRLSRIGRSRRSTSTREMRALARASKNENINISTAHLTKSNRRQIIVHSDSEDNNSTNMSISSDEKSNYGKGNSIDENSEGDTQSYNIEAVVPKIIKSKQSVPKIRKNNLLEFCNWNVHINNRRTVPATIVDIDRAWLQDDKVHDSLYCPQLGDHIVYFPQGHIELLQSFAEGSSPPWTSFPQKWPVVECVVKDLAYEFPSLSEYRQCSSILCIITLQIIGIPIRRQITSISEYVIEFGSQKLTRNSSQTQENPAFSTFTVTLRNYSLPDFMVPYHLFMRCCNKVQWHEGIRINVTYRDFAKTNTSSSSSSNSSSKKLVDYVYTARVINLCDASPDWPQSPWEALQIRFESENPLDEESNSLLPIERIGIWEATPLIDSSNNFSRACLRYPPPKIPLDICQNIDSKIDKLMESNKGLFDPFEFEVDSIEFPQYYGVIPVPMYVDLIRRRLKNQYYRQIEALEFDIEEIYRNCLHFNQDGTEIIEHSSMLVEKLRQIIKGEDEIENINFSEKVEVFSDNKENYNETISTVQDDEKLLLKLTRRGKLAKSTIKSEDSLQLQSQSNENRDSNLVLRVKKSEIDSANIINECGRSTRERTLKIYNDDSTIHDDVLHRLPRSTKINGKRESSRRSSKRLINKTIHYNEDDQSESSSSEESIEVTKNTRSSSRLKVLQKVCNDDYDEEVNLVDDTFSSDNRRSKRLRKDSHYDYDKDLKFVDQNKTIESNIHKVTGRAKRKEEIFTKYNKNDFSDNDSDDDDNENALDSVDEESINIYDNTKKYSTRSRHNSSIKNDDINSYSRRFNGIRSDHLDDTSKYKRSASVTKSSSNYRDMFDFEDDINNTKMSLRPKGNNNNFEENVPSINGSTRPIRSTRLSSNSQGNHENTIARCSLANFATSNQSNSSKSNTNNNKEDYNNKIGFKRQDPDIRRKITNLLNTIENEDRNQFFSDPVTDDIVEGYSMIISNPMDLSTIRKKYRDRKYESFEDILSDFNLMFDNCELFNDPISKVYKESKRLRKVLKSIIESEFN